MKYYKKEDFLFYNFRKDSFELKYEISQDSIFYERSQNDYFVYMTDVSHSKLLSRLKKLYVKNLL